jgi:DNA-binding transcriptional LysR family regulator
MSTMPSWDDLRAVHAVLETGSLSGAARLLGVAQPTVRSRVGAAEHGLGAVLFTRSVAGLVPTEHAKGLGVHLRAMDLAADALVRTSSGAVGEISGTVRISVSEFVGAVVLPAMLVQLRIRHPGLSVEIVPSNDSVDLIAQEADIAVRMYPPRQDGLIARKVGTVGLSLFASAEYVARRGVPTEQAQLKDHDLIGPDRARGDLAVIERIDPGHDRQSFVVRTDSHFTAYSAVRAGAGIGAVQRPIGQRDPSLVPVLPHFIVAELGIWLVMHEDFRRLPKVRASFDHLAEAFARYTREA